MGIWESKIPKKNCENQSLLDCINFDLIQKLTKQRNGEKNVKLSLQKYRRYSNCNVRKFPFLQNNQ